MLALKPRARLCLAAGLLAGLSSYGGAEPSSLEERLQAVEAKQKALESSPRLQAGPEGFGLSSADSQFQLNVSGDMQADGRFFLSDDAGAASDGFLIRRVRPTLEMKAFGYVTGRIQANLAASNPSLDDAYIDLQPRRWAGLRAGRFKSPFGLETLQSSARLTFVERSLASNLTPVYDNGAQVQGALGPLNYALAYVNGALDGASADTNTADRQDAAARLWLTPFSKSKGILKDLGIGLAATAGSEFSASTGSASGLPAYKTEGLNTFFTYTGMANGDRRRWSPQLSWYPGDASLVAEYAVSRQDVRSLGGAAASLTHRAWQTAGTWVLAGGRTSPKGFRVNRSLRPASGDWGGWELAGRYSQLAVDKNSFGAFADLAKSARSARAWTGGVNWYLNQWVKAQSNYTYTWFDGGAPGGGSRAPERALFSRLQLAF